MEITITKEQLETIQNFHLPTYKEIPNVGLYLDQTAKFINEYMALLPGREMTISMISNYVKKKLIDNPIKREYNRDQIAHLIFIALTKSIISLDDVGKLFQIQKDNYNCEIAYNYFVARFENSLRAVFGLEEDTSKAPTHKEELLLNGVITAVVHSIYVEECCRSLREES